MESEEKIDILEMVKEENEHPTPVVFDPEELKGEEFTVLEKILSAIIIGLMIYYIYGVFKILGWL